MRQACSLLFSRIIIGFCRYNHIVAWVLTHIEWLTVYFYSYVTFSLWQWSELNVTCEPRQANLCLPAFRHEKNITAHAQPFRGARDLAFCLKVPLDSLLIWASSEGSGETARMRRLAWTFAARIGYKYQIRLTRSMLWWGYYYSDSWGGTFNCGQPKI